MYRTSPSDLPSSKSAPITLSIRSLQTYFNAPDLTNRLVDFLGALCHKYPLIRLPALENYTKLPVNVYKHVNITIQPGDGILGPFVDKVRATPGRVEGILPSVGEHASFETVLGKIPPGNCYKSMII